MASSMTRATAVGIFVNYWNSSRDNKLVQHNADLLQAKYEAGRDILSLLQTIDTDGEYDIVFDEPRVTITPYDSGDRPIRISVDNTLNYTVAVTGGETISTPVTFSSVNLPSWISLNPSTGVLTGTPPAISTYTHNKITGGSTANVEDNYDIFYISAKNAFGEATNGPCQFSISVTNSLAPTVNSDTTIWNSPSGDFSYTITATNTPTSYNAYNLDLLGDLTLDSETGIITGTLADDISEGEHTFYVSATNEYGTGEEMPIVLTISDSLAPTITSSLTNSALQAGSLSYQITASRTPTSYHAYGLAALPGITLNESSGLISGTVSNSQTIGDYEVEITASNSNGEGVRKTLVISIALGLPVVSSAGTKAAIQNELFSYQIVATKSPSSYSVSNLTALPGLSLNASTGLISGTVADDQAVGDVTIAVRATNTSGQGAAKDVVVSTALGYPVISSALTKSNVAGTAFSYTITATKTPTSFSATGLDALTGLSLDTKTGIISGTLDAAFTPGEYTVVIRGINGSGNGPTSNLVVTITAP